MTGRTTTTGPQHEPAAQRVGSDSPARPRARDTAAELPADALRTELIEVARRLSSGTYELLVLVGELDARGTWALWGALSCAAWLADACDVELGTARSQVRVARALRAHPLLDDAMRTGDLSYAKARVLVPHLCDDNVDALVDLAVVTPAGRLGAADRRLGPTPRRPRGDPPPPTRRPLGELAHRARRHGRHHRPAHPRHRRRRVRRDRPAGDRRRRARGRVPRPTTRRCPGLRHHRRRRRRHRRDGRPRRRDRQHPPRRHPPRRTTPSPACSPTRSSRCSCTTPTANPSTPAPADASPPAANAASSTPNNPSANTPAATPTPSSNTTTSTPTPKADPPSSPTSRSSADPTTAPDNPRPTP